MKRVFLASIGYIYILYYVLKTNYIFNSNLESIMYSFCICLLPLILSLIYSKYIKQKDATSAVTKRIVRIFSIIISIFLIYSFNIYKHSLQKPVKVEISATDTKNIKSQGANLYLDTLKFDNRYIEYSQMKKQGYIKENGQLELIPNKKKPTKITVYGKANQVFLVLNCNNNTGIANIKINEKNYKIDSFNNTDFKIYDYHKRPYSFNVRSSFSPIEIIQRYLYIFDYFIIFYLSIYFLSLIIINKRIDIYLEQQEINLKKSILLYILPMIIFWVFMLLIFYPAIVPFDSLTQLKQVHTYNFANEHPLFHTYLMYLLTKIWNSPAIIAITQILSAIFVISYTLLKLEKAGVKRYILFAISIIIAATPFNNFMLVSLWKDAFFSIALFGLTASILVFFIEKESFFNSKANRILLITSAIFTTFTRYNGIFIGIICFLALIFACKKLAPKLISKMFNYAMTYLVFCLLIQIYISSLNAYQCSFIFNQTFEVPMHQIQSVFHYNGRITEKEEKTLEQILPLSHWNSFYLKYSSHDFIFGTEKLRTQKINPIQVIKAYLMISKDNKWIMFKDWLNLNSFIFKYKHTPEGANFTQSVACSIENDSFISKHNKVSDNNLFEKSFFPQLKQNIKSFIYSQKFYDFLFKPTPYFIILLVFGGIFVINNGILYSIFLLPSILNLFFISISLPEMSPRYIFILFLIYPIIMLSAFIKLNKE